MTNNVVDITASQLMTTDVLAVPAEWSIKQLADFFVKHKISGAPVISNDQKMVGVVSVSDMVQFNSLSAADKSDLVANNVYTEVIGQPIMQEDVNKLASHAGDNCNVDSIMTPHVINVEINATLPEIAGLMHKRHIHRVFVTENGEISGVISTSNILEMVSKM
ncbi:MAG: CBS domain-containing protein [Pseudomonadales bacterium]|nr:CBS domain-containing protein [Pseudomonadales bacterium]